MPAALRDLASGEVFELDDVALIGRGEAAGVRLTDTSISRQHASIRRENGAYWVVDLGSANGTFVNDVALTTGRALRNGDRVQFGDRILSFEHNEAGSDADELHSAKTQISRLSPAPLRSAPVTLLVADLKGFTGISASLSPGEVADLLRDWYAHCNLVLKRHGASIDKFIGDCVFAYWHGTDGNSRASALAAAAALRLPAGAQAQSPGVSAVSGGSALDCRIGLHVGRVAVGNMGKGVNTALGDAVNVAFRIEALTRRTDRPILVSAAFLDDWSDGRPDFESCGRHAVKGLPEPIEVFAPL